MGWFWLVMAVVEGKGMKEQVRGKKRLVGHRGRGG